MSCTLSAGLLFWTYLSQPNCCPCTCMHVCSRLPTFLHLINNNLKSAASKLVFPAILNMRLVWGCGVMLEPLSQPRTAPPPLLLSWWGITISLQYMMNVSIKVNPPNTWCLELNWSLKPNQGCYHLKFKKKIHVISINLAKTLNFINQQKSRVGDISSPPFHSSGKPD